MLRYLIAGLGVFTIFAKKRTTTATAKTSRRQPSNQPGRHPCLCVATKKKIEEERRQKPNRSHYDAEK